MKDSKQFGGYDSGPYIGMPIYLDGDSWKEPEENSRNYPGNRPIAMAYVPVQQWETPYEAEEAFARGTVFPSLDLPFTGGAGR